MKRKSHYLFVRLVGLSVLLMLMLSCSLPALLSRDTGMEAVDEESEEPVLPAGSDGEEAQGSADGERLGHCPTEDQTWYLSFGHNFQVDTPFGPWKAIAWGNKPVYFYADGTIAVDPVETLEGAVYTELISGDNFCSGHAFVDIYASIDASCSNGVVSMTIYEDWQYQEFTMTCDDDTIQFDIPSYGTTEHKNLTFPLMASGSSMQTHPFQGGSGAKTWILSYEPPLVPLVDPDELDPASWTDE
ncbi:MAG: hypothetical protein JXA25_06060 [Anaerolineales bacterium]|nr:hypothetical protein [Anaerolineales bacterium]